MDPHKRQTLAMKEVIFRPLRRVKKTGKITVASYMQWRKVKTADYNKFNLIVSDEYKTFHPDEFVYDHKGELLYWFDLNPAEIPIFQSSVDFDWQGVTAKHKHFGVEHSGRDEWISWIGTGLDCSGVPTFSHWDYNYVADYYKDVQDVTPLTVGMVVKWFGWFLLQLQNSYLQIGKK